MSLPSAPLFLDRAQLGMGLVVFVMVKTRHHSASWLKQFRKHVSTIPEVIDFFRIGGEYDYLLKIVTQDMHGYDHVYKRLIDAVYPTINGLPSAVRT